MQPMFYPWIRLATDAWFLSLEATNVVALRLARLALGGRQAEAESRKMLDEKFAALLALQWQLMTGGLGSTALEISRGSLRHYRKAVRRNRRRLARQSK
jgi:hypothetical protein